MKAIATKRVEITLTLDEVEATWLRNIMQNPMNAVHPDNEDLSERDSRHGLFCALRDTLANVYKGEYSNEKV